MNPPLFANQPFAGKFHNLLYKSTNLKSRAIFEHVAKCRSYLTPPASPGKLIKCCSSEGSSIQSN